MLIEGAGVDDWPLFGLRLRCGEVTLRPVREDDLPRLAAILPDDFEQDPRLERLPGLSAAAQERGRFCQGYWRALGAWSPSSWSLHLAVEFEGEPVGVQTLEGEDFPALRTVDSASWLTRRVRGRGLGVAMRTAALGLAFERLGAVAAVSSAVPENAASLGVSRRIGYAENGVGLVATPGGRVVELRHLRLTADRWRAAGHGSSVSISGFGPCRPWFGLT
ncbi:GNAT family protein [Actinoplanes sp. NPDC049668]|uniref:GNAT family N-acetyltransferase n=1 Tax=unclassified Actinoplanes TaxID=2626549 RepID=UPI0033B49305